ncbi:MAG: lipid-A-disaccharide synthase [Bacteroidales bacterium]|nr:lipid-A-disaccharide synthase [Bacteroidales bacterium]
MKYYIIAGEASGDLHGANLMRSILRKDPNAEIRYWGGDAMQEVQGHPVRHIRDLAYMGIVEVAAHLSTVLGNIRFCKEDILAFNPDVIVYIDYPGFNLKIAKFAHAHGFKNVHYISPQLWAWKKGRIKSMRKVLDKLCYILPFEQDFYANNNFPKAVYVGHPLLDAASRYVVGEPITAPDGKKIVALLPGSRRMELKKTLPKMMAVVKAYPQYHFVVAGMTLLGDSFYKPLIEKADNITVVYDRTYDLLASAFAAIVCSGTATLEAALFNVPQVVCYRANAVSAAIARVLIGDKIRFISLPNLIADQAIVAELIQDDFSESRLIDEFAKVTDDVDNRQRIIAGYSKIHHLLGDAGASDRTAEEIYSLMNQ